MKIHLVIISILALPGFLVAASTDIYLSAVSSSSPTIPGSSYASIVAGYTTAPLTRSAYPYLSMSNYLGKGTITSRDATGRALTYTVDRSVSSLHVYARPKLIYTDPSRTELFLTSYYASSTQVAADAAFYVGKGWLEDKGSFSIGFVPDTSIAPQLVTIRRNSTSVYVGGYNPTIIWTLNYHLSSNPPAGFPVLGKGWISGTFYPGVFHQGRPFEVLYDTAFKQQFTPGTGVNGVASYQIYQGEYKISIDSNSVVEQIKFKSTTPAVMSNLYLGKGFLNATGTSVVYQPSVGN